MPRVTSLRCHFGSHTPRSGGVWNHGYCFTTCERCGRDMVRSVFGEWHVPKGFRVVAHGDAATIAEFDAAMTARDAAVELPPVPVPVPVQEVAIKQIARLAPLAPAPVAQPPTAGSPFNFRDFDAIDPTVGVFADPLPGPAAPPLSRAAP